MNAEETIKVQYDDGMCAVQGCRNPGRRQVCPYDNRYHHHGKIHYENQHRWHPDLHFKRGPWRGVCDAHMKVILDSKTAYT